MMRLSPADYDDEKFLNLMPFLFLLFYRLSICCFVAYNPNNIETLCPKYATSKNLGNLPISVPILKYNIFISNIPASHATTL